MPDVYGPFDSATWGQGPWFRDAWARSLSGVFGAPHAAGTAGDLALNVSGLTVSIGTGRAHVRGAGYERTGSAWSTTLPTNTNANPRIDRAVLRRDLAAKTVVPAILQGTPAASPAAPALTQSEDGVWELPLHSFRVPGGSGTTLTAIVDERQPADVNMLRQVALWPQTYDETSGLITSIAPGWSLTSALIQRAGLGLCYISTTWTRTGAAIAVPASGDIANITLGVLDARFRPPANVPMTNQTSGPIANGVLGASGNMLVTALAPNYSLATNETVQLTSTFYPLATP